MSGRPKWRGGRYRIDAVAGDELVEIQHGRLGAISFKIAELLKNHDVRVVKPIVPEKQIIKRRRRGGKIVSQRRSPKRGKLLDVFHDLVYFTKVFPHPRLTIEAVLVDVEEEALSRAWPPAPLSPQRFSGRRSAAAQHGRFLLAAARQPTS